MTVKRLIEKLQALKDQNLEVFIVDEDGGGPWSGIGIHKRNNPENYPDSYNMPEEWIELEGC